MDQSNNSAAPSTQSNTTPAIAGVAHNHPPPADSNNENSMISIADLNTIMKSQGISPASQAQIIGTLTNNNNNNQGGSSTVDMASVLAKIQALERDKIELSNQLSSTNSALTKYREEKSVGMKDKYIKEMKDFIDGLQLKDPEVKNSMHARMEDLAKQGNETGVWEILACASSNHKANVNQIETLTTELNSYRDKEKQLQGGMFQSEMNRIEHHHHPLSSSIISDSSIVGSKRSREEDSNAPSGNIWDDFQQMVMKQGGNRGDDYGGGGGR